MPAGAFLVVAGGAGSGVTDDFCGSVIDAAWGEENINNSTALIYNMPLEGALTVTDIQPANSNTAGWVERKMVRNFNSIRGDFTAGMDLSWDQQDVESMSSVIMSVVAADGEVLASAGLWDGWIGYYGKSAYVIGAEALQYGDRMPKATPATFSIERAGDDYSIKLNTLVLTNGTGSVKDVARVEVLFGYRIYFGPPVSHFPEIGLDRITVAPGVIPDEPASTDPWVMGEPTITYWAGPAPMTDAVAQQMANGGFNLAWVNSTGMGDLFLIDHYLEQLDILYKNGLRGILSLGHISRDPAAPTVFQDPQQKAMLDSILDGVKNHPALYAYHLIDEPSASIFTHIAQLKSYILSKDPGRLVHVNLYPSSASGSQLGVASYTEYLSQYMSIVKPQLLSYDRYHFAESGDSSIEAFFSNLNDIRNAATNAAIPFRGIYQACSWTVNMRIPTGEEMRWLANTSLAYGAGGLAWYVYGWPGHDGGFIYPDSPASGGGEPTSLYYYAKEVIHKEGLNIARALQPLNSVGVYHHGQIPVCAAALTSNEVFYIDPPMPQESVDATGKPIEGYVVGFFGANQAPTHAMVVNMDYRTYSGIAQERCDEFRNPASRHLVGPGPLDVFNAQTGQWISISTNRVPIELAPAGALLVRLQ